MPVLFDANEKNESKYIQQKFTYNGIDETCISELAKLLKEMPVFQFGAAVQTPKIMSKL